MLPNYNIMYRPITNATIQYERNHHNVRSATRPSFTYVRGLGLWVCSSRRARMVIGVVVAQWHITHCDMRAESRLILHYYITDVREV